ncbi:MAG: hypothetical protein JWO77_2844 [Ilumatobacteraceae bacterium]|nr:hypothetical protein [Ilumatobacteraceae bacterium]
MSDRWRKTLLILGLLAIGVIVRILFGGFHSSDDGLCIMSYTLGALAAAPTDLRVFLWVIAAGLSTVALLQNSIRRWVVARKRRAGDHPS